MGALSEGSVWPKAAVVTLGFSFLFYLICFGAPNWCKTDESEADNKEHIGLWRYCTYPYGGGESCDDFIDIIVGDWLKVSQSFMTLALFAYLGAFGVVIVYAFVPDFAGDMRIFGAAIAVTSATFLFLLIGISVFGGKCHEYFENKQPGTWDDITQKDWAFWIAITCLTLCFMAVIFLLLDLLLGKREKY